jgi:hypothetical protein
LVLQGFDNVLHKFNQQAQLLIEVLGERSRATHLLRTPGQRLSCLEVGAILVVHLLHVAG